MHTLAAEIAARRLSPVDLVDEYLNRIERLEPRLQAFVSVNAANARLAAEAADKAIRSGHAVGPLHGIPIAIKDLVEIEGEVAMGGTAAWRNRIAPRTATLHAQADGGGHDQSGQDPYRRVRLWRLGHQSASRHAVEPVGCGTHRAPGGSSSGSGVAVAARMAPWAIGTDTGGSVRIPAAWNGITGLKTTIGRVSTFGVLPLSPTLDTPGPITRDIEDAALLLTVLQGADPRDPHTLGVHDVDPMPDLRRGVKGLRLGRLPADERARRSMPRCWPPTIDPSTSSPRWAPRSSTSTLAGAVRRSWRDQWPHHVGRDLRGAIAGLVDDNAHAVGPGRAAAGACRGGDLLEGLSGRAGGARAHEAAFNAAIEGVDALLTPTTVTPAPGGLDRSEHDAGGVHALGQFSRPVRGGGAEWVHRWWLADVTADRLPGL